MAAYFYTSNPQSLLNKFDGAIAKGDGPGSITTWQKIDIDYAHKASEWERRAYFEPHVDNGRLRFSIVKNIRSFVSVSVYSYYHGHLIETFLRHFDRDFDVASSSALGTDGDFLSSDSD